MTIAISLVLFLGAVLITIAGIGLVRLPDFYLRTAATTKAITLGVTLMLLGAAVFFGEAAVTARVIGVILFLMLTSPVGAHMIGRAAYRSGVPLWNRTVADQWKDRLTSGASGVRPKTRKTKNAPASRKRARSTAVRKRGGRSRRS